MIGSSKVDFQSNADASEVRSHGSPSILSARPNSGGAGGRQAVSELRFLSNVSANNVRSTKSIGSGSPNSGKRLSLATNNAPNFMSLVPVSANQRSVLSQLDNLPGTKRLSSAVYSPNNYRLNTNYEREFGSLLKSQGGTCLDQLE